MTLPRRGFGWTLRSLRRLTREARERLGDSGTSRPKASSSNDAPVLARFVGVGGEGLVGVEVLVALDGEAERPAEGAKFGHADESQFGKSYSQIAETGYP